jgi:hypothetical protein
MVLFRSIAQAEAEVEKDKMRGLDKKQQRQYDNRIMGIIDKGINKGGMRINRPIDKSRLQVGGMRINRPTSKMLQVAPSVPTAIENMVN